jgi:hypothetical protein
MKRLVQWFKEYNNEITWWIIGWLTFAVVDCILRENWTFVVINTGLIYINYKLWKNNNA